MKMTQLRLRNHTAAPGQQIIEIWYDDQFIGQVTGANDMPGIRVISKHPAKVSTPAEMVTELHLDLTINSSIPAIELLKDSITENEYKDTVLKALRKTTTKQLLDEIKSLTGRTDKYSILMLALAEVELQRRNDALES